MTDTIASFFRPKAAQEGHKVSTFELLFDLVFVFAFTHVTGFMAQRHSAIGVLEAMVILALLWWSWTSYSWLANQTRVDEGVVRFGMSIAMVAMFIVALCIPDVFAPNHGGLDASIVLAVAYLIVRVMHGVLYLFAAGDDIGLRHQLYRSSVALAVGGGLILAGAIIGGAAQIWFWTIGMVADVILTYLTSRNGDWRLNSAAHWSERYGLVILLALGESIVAIGTGAANEPLTWQILLGTFFAITLTISLWWLYFDVTAIAAEHLLGHLHGVKRASMASDAYTYMHWLLIAGIMISALGVREVISVASDTGSLGLFGASALFGGTALYQAGHALFWRRIAGQWKWWRLTAGAVELLLIPVGAMSHSLVALAIVVAITVTVAFAETKKEDIRRASIRALRAD